MHGEAPPQAAARHSRRYDPSRSPSFRSLSRLHVIMTTQDARRPFSRSCRRRVRASSNNNGQDIHVLLCGMVSPTPIRDWGSVSRTTTRYPITLVCSVALVGIAGAIMAAALRDPTKPESLGSRTGGLFAGILFLSVWGTVAGFVAREKGLSRSWLSPCLIHSASAGCPCLAASQRETSQ